MHWQTVSLIDALYATVIVLASHSCAKFFVADIKNFLASPTLLSQFSFFETCSALFIIKVERKRTKFN